MPYEGRSLQWVGERLATDEGIELEVVEVTGFASFRARRLDTGEVVDAYASRRIPPKGWTQVRPDLDKLK